MSTEPFIGEVKQLAFNFAPRGYMLCMGQTMSIAQNSALFALIGTTYGGDGVQTFKLPDLQGRVPIHQGTGPGLPTVSMGQASGSYSVTLSTANMPAHIHSMFSARASVNVNGNQAGENSPDGAFFGTNTQQAFYASQPADMMAANVIGVSGSTDMAGSNLPIDITNPLLCINYSIATEGIFPSRN
jgi:microcystin-dependent protein